MILNHVPEAQRSCSWLVRGGRQGGPSRLTWVCWGEVSSLTRDRDFPFRLPEAEIATHFGPHNVKFPHRLPKAAAQPGLGTCRPRPWVPISHLLCPVSHSQWSFHNPLYWTRASHLSSLPLITGQPLWHLAQASPPSPKVPRSEESSQPCGPGGPRKGSLRSKAELPPRTCPHKLLCLRCVSLEKVTCV